MAEHPDAVDHPYDPWADLQRRWPDVEVVLEPMPPGLLGELRYPLIALRAGTSAAQRRCTLTHEIVHLERGVRDCGPWQAREEMHVHREVARRLIDVAALARAVRFLGGDDDRAALACALDVDAETLALRLKLLSSHERSVVRAASLAAAGGAA